MWPRASRVFDEKTNGLIVDYCGMFRDLEKALAKCGSRPILDWIGLAHPNPSCKQECRPRYCVCAPTGLENPL